MFVRRFLFQRDGAVGADRRLAIFVAAPMYAYREDRFSDLSQDNYRRIEAATGVYGDSLHVNDGVAIFRFKGRFTFMNFAAVAGRFRDVIFYGIYAGRDLFLYRRLYRFNFGGQRVDFLSRDFAQVGVVMGAVLGDQPGAGLCT